MNKVVFFAINWFMKTYNGLTISELYNKIAKMANVEVSMLRKLEKPMIKTSMRLMDTKYLKKC